MYTKQYLTWYTQYA